MRSVNQQEALVLIGGDIILFFASLWLTLLVRYAGVPSWSLVGQHMFPFTFLFVVWMGVFFIAGLYEKHTLSVKSKLPMAMLNAQVSNSLIAIIFFYFVPYFGITPKTTLFVYLVISSMLILGWRLYGIHHIIARRQEKAFLVGSGREMQELYDEVNGNPRYGCVFSSVIDIDTATSNGFEENVVKKIAEQGVSLVVIDLENKKIDSLLPHLYELIFSKIQFVDQYKMYEDTFDRVPLSLIGYPWFLENISHTSHLTYDLLKRGMDVSIGVVLGVFSLVVYPLVWLAIRLDDNGPVFITQNRVGQGNKEITIFKFRTMNSYKEGIEEHKKITRVGKVLRASRIDELPQLWNVVRGDISLVGPRPELPDLVTRYAHEIPYYSIRHLIKPGLSGWAQIHPEKPPKFGVAPEETKVKLSYDLYYIKNRSFFLDMKIALKTLKTLISRSGI